MKHLHLRAHTAHDAHANHHDTPVHCQKSWKKYYSFLRFGKKHQQQQPRRPTTPQPTYSYLTTPLPGAASSSAFLSPSPSPPAHSNSTFTSNEQSDPNPCVEFDLEDINFEIYQSDMAEPSQRISSWNGKPSTSTPHQYQSLSHSHSLPVLAPRPILVPASPPRTAVAATALPPTPPPKSHHHRNSTPTHHKLKSIPLPPELWFEIALHLPPPSISHLSLTSRSIRNAVIPFLFQRISFDSSLSPGQSLSDYLADLVQRVSFLTAVSGIRSYVKEILIAPRRAKRWKHSSLSPRSDSPASADDYAYGGTSVPPNMGVGVGAAMSSSLDNQGTRIMVELGMSAPVDFRLLTRPDEENLAVDAEICETGVDFIFNHLHAWFNLRSLTLSGIVLSYERMCRLEELGLRGLRDLRLIECKEMEQVDLLAFRVSIKNLRFDDLLLDDPEDDPSNDGIHDSTTIIIPSQPLPISSALPAPFLDAQSVSTLVTGLRSAKTAISWIIKSKYSYTRLTFLSIPVTAFYRPEILSAFRQCPNVRHLQLHTKGMTKTQHRSIHNLPGHIPREVLTRLEWYEGPWQFVQLFCESDGESSRRSPSPNPNLTSPSSPSPTSSQCSSSHWTTSRPRLRPSLKKVTLLPQNESVIFVNPITLVEHCLSKLPTDLEELEVRLVTQVGWTIMRAVKERFIKLRRMSLCCGEDGDVGGGVGEGVWGTTGMCKRKKGINVPVPTNVRDLKVVVGGPPAPLVGKRSKRVPVAVTTGSSEDYSTTESSSESECAITSEDGIPIVLEPEWEQEPEEELRTEIPGIGLPVTLEELEIGVRINPDIYDAEREAMAELVGAFVWQCWNAQRVRMVFGFGEAQREGGYQHCHHQVEKRKVAVWKRGYRPCGGEEEEEGERDREVWDVRKEDLSILDVEDEPVEKW